MNRSTHAFLLAIGGLTTLFVAVWIGTAFVLTAQQDTLAEKASRKLLKTAFAARRDNLERFALDYTSWDSAYEMVAAHDLDWAYGNMGSSVELGTFDNMTIAYPDGTSFGWTSETADELVSSPVPSFAVAAMKSRLSGLEFGLRAIGYIWIDDAFWLYTAAQFHPVSHDLSPDLQRDAPLGLFGIRYDRDRLMAIGDSVLIDGVELRRDIATATPDAILLPGFLGADTAALEWERPAPGSAALRAWAIPGAALVVLVLAVSFAAGRFILRMAARLKAALDEAKAADRAKSVLLANVSHELRTPMNGILGAAQILQDGTFSDDDRELVDIIETSALSQLELIEDLIRIARVDSGDLAINPEPVDIAALLASATAALRLAATQKGLRFGLKVGTDVPVLMLDPRLLRQSVINLVGNAVKFTHSGSVEIHASWQGQADGAGTLRIRVADQGIGIPKDQQEWVFERFAQANQSTVREYGGTGLGLSITRSLIGGMGGTIALDSAPGAGCVFTISIPVSRAGDVAVAQDGPVRRIAA